jgi:hypothetical protein
MGTESTPHFGETHLNTRSGLFFFVTFQRKISLRFSRSSAHEKKE